MCFPLIWGVRAGSPRSKRRRPSLLRPASTGNARATQCLCPQAPRRPATREVYFCDPRSPWQRGSNENTNGLLRQYFPKGKSLAGVTQADLDEVARKLNDRPRQTLGFRTPAEKLTELIDGLETGAPGR
jgi:hypothetical protein